MKNTFFLFLMAVGFTLGPTFISSAGDSVPGMTIYSKPGDYHTDDYKPVEGWENWEWGEVTIISQPKEQEKLSRPFPNKIETKVLMAGNAVLVPVKLGYKEKELSTWLVFDTGATTTTLHKSVGDELGISPNASGKIAIADGTVIDMQKVTLDYMIVGPYRMDNLQAVIIDHKNDSNSNMVKGLLGMNFLRAVNYKIDFARKRIKWSDK
ncbi:MAG: retropepsin-like aspartic protease [Desulfobacula sp.]|nr:retropepsin-like aspartic protease [Desulfobacula sp.]